MKGNASTSLMKTLCNKKPPVASSIYKSNSSSITTPLSVQTNSLSGQGQYESSNTQKKIINPHLHHLVVQHWMIKMASNNLYHRL